MAYTQGGVGKHLRDAGAKAKEVAARAEKKNSKKNVCKPVIPKLSNKAKAIQGTVKNGSWLSPKAQI